MTDQAAFEFASEWIAAWNAHDLERILAHYDDDFEMSSPFVEPLAGEASGRLQGKAKIRRYWETALKMVPDLRFKLLDVFSGVGGLVIRYQGHKGPVAEVFRFGPSGKVVSASAYYAP